MAADLGDATESLAVLGRTGRRRTAVWLVVLLLTAAILSQGAAVDKCELCNACIFIYTIVSKNNAIK